MSLNNGTAPDKHPQKANRHWSISSRLSLAFALSGALILISCSSILYWGLKSNLIAQHRQFIFSEIDHSRKILRSSDDFDQIKEKLSLHNQSQQFIQPFYRLMDKRGRILFENFNMGQVIPNNLIPKVPTTTDPYGERIRWEAPNGHIYILRTFWVEVGKTLPQRAVLLEGFDVTPVNNIIVSYRNKLIIVIGLGILLSTFCGIYLTRRELKPLSDINALTQRIGITNLTERINPDKLPQELNTLAGSFNKMLDRLGEAFERLFHCASNLSHELRTPLNNLIGETQVLLSKEDRTPHEYRKAMESNLEEYERLSQLVEKLVFLARADNNNIEIERYEVQANEELQNVIELYQGLAEENDITLSCSGDARLFVDRVLFRRAATNLVANAIKYSPSGATVSVTCKQVANGGGEITVTDTGFGISTDEQSKIFDRFYRAKNTQHLHPKSTGLGLAIVKSIVTIHGGSIDLQSEPEKGSRITLYFPPPPAAS